MKGYDQKTILNYLVNVQGTEESLEQVRLVLLGGGLCLGVVVYRVLRHVKVVAHQRLRAVVDQRRAKQLCDRVHSDKCAKYVIS